MQSRLAVYNTLTQQKEPFVSLRPGKVGMFVCGPTVQDYMHLGHARTYVFYDVVARYLAHLGYEVKFILNITDVDERITSEAKRTGVEPLALARKYSRYFVEDMAKLKADSICSFEPVSEYVEEMIDQVALLMSKGHAYVVGDWVYFDVSTFPDFGRLSHQSPRELSLRPLELSKRKRNLLDFALWRPETLVEGKWDSPWGRGSPGWHIQDTAVTAATLGPQYDLHGGAYELIYPHHEAELAEAESLTGLRPFVKYWVHTRLVNMKGEKMSKSTGNVYTVRDALRNYSADQLRMFLLGQHYRKDMDLRRIDSAAKAYTRLRAAAAKNMHAVSGVPSDLDEGFLQRFCDAMNDDFDTPLALKVLGEGLASLSGMRSDGAAARKLASIRAAGNILGIDLGLGKR
ncbi:MAG: cysteine--tRNA ligase [Candidatus Gagatemarchaeaceae archaeon]